MRALITILFVGLFFFDLSIAKDSSKILALKRINTTVLDRLNRQPIAVNWMERYSVKLKKYCSSMGQCNNSGLTQTVCKAQPSSFRKACLDGALGFCSECVGLKNSLNLLHETCKNKLSKSEDCRIYYGLAIGDANQIKYLLQPFD